MPPAAGGFSPKLTDSSCWGLRPQTPKTAPPLRISGYAPGSHKGYVLFVCYRLASNSGKIFGLRLSEDLFFSFFFCFSPDFGQKIGLNLGGTSSYSEKCIVMAFGLFACNCSHCLDYPIVIWVNSV